MMTAANDLTDDKESCGFWTQLGCTREQNRIDILADPSTSTARGIYHVAMTGWKKSE